MRTLFFAACMMAVAAMADPVVVVFGPASSIHATAVGAGAGWPAPVPQTGQTNIYVDYDDGYYRKGETLPATRFAVQANTNCILDNLTGLIWARNATVIGLTNWASGITLCEALDYGGRTDWRMPNIKEMSSLLDLENNSPPLPTGHPFLNVTVNANYYWWSSTTSDRATTYAQRVHTLDGYGAHGLKTANTTVFAWPCSGPD